MKQIGLIQSRNFHTEVHIPKETDSIAKQNPQVFWYESEINAFSNRPHSILHQQDSR